MMLGSVSAAAIAGTTSVRLARGASDAVVGLEASIAPASNASGQDLCTEPTGHHSSKAGPGPVDKRAPLP